MNLRISSRDGRGGYGRPIALIERDSGEFIAGFRNAASGMRALVLLEQIGGYARDSSAAELHELAAETCQRLYGSSDYDRLGLPRFNTLLATIRNDLGAGRNRSKGA